MTRDQAAQIIGAKDCGAIALQSMWLAAEGFAALVQGDSSEARDSFDAAIAVGRLAKAIADHFPEAGT